MNKIYTKNFIVNIKSFESSYEFTNYLYDLISKFANSKSITYPDIININLNNGKYNMSLLFVYPYIDRSISYNIFFRENINKVYITIYYNL